MLAQLWQEEKDILKFLEEHGPEKCNYNLLSVMDSCKPETDILIPHSIFLKMNVKPISFQQACDYIADQNTDDNALNELLTGLAIESHNFEDEIKTINQLIQKHRPNMKLSLNSRKNEKS